MINPCNLASLYLIHVILTPQGFWRSRTIISSRWYHLLLLNHCISPSFWSEENLNDQTSDSSFPTSNTSPPEHLMANRGCVWEVTIYLFSWWCLRYWQKDIRWDQEQKMAGRWEGRARQERKCTAAGEKDLGLLCSAWWLTGSHQADQCDQEADYNCWSP